MSILKSIELFPKTAVDQAAAAASEAHFFDPSQWTVVDETKDHPGRRKSSGFLQPIKHLSGRKGRRLSCGLCEGGGHV